MTNPDGYTALDLVGYTDQGDYDATKSYVANDLVHYDGSIWCCLIDDTTGITPTEGVNWRFWVEDSQNGISDIVNILGAKNLLPYPYVDGDSKTIAGVTFSVDNNGIVHANGTSTTYCSYDFANNQSPLKLNAGKYILSSGVSLPIYIYFGAWYCTISPSTNTNLVALRLNNVEQEFEITEEMATKIENGEAYILVRLASDSYQGGVSWDNMTLYPMIRPSGIEDDTWQPYTKTNKELTAEVTQNSSDIQTLSNQVSTNTSNISANATAIAKCETLVVSVPSFSALPQTITNANIDDDMVVVNSVLSNPSAQTSDWTVTTSSGSLTISGSISGTTTATLYLMKSR